MHTEVRGVEQLEQVVEQPSELRVVLVLRELLGPELADRLEHPEAARLPAAHEALVDERLHELEAGARDPLRRLERPAAPEDRERREQPPLLGLEQLVRPLERRPERLLASLRIPASA